MRPIKRWIFLAGLLVLGAAWPAGAFAASAKDNYRTYCVQCHGLAGNGQGINVRDMSVQPRNHTDASYMSSRSDQDLFAADTKGGLAIDKSVLMPPWGDTLSSREIHDMVQYLRVLCHCHGPQ